MPIVPKDLLDALRPQVKALQADLLKRADDPGVDAGLRKAHQAERDAERTGEGFAPWRRERCTQIAVAWILSVVFVRTLEDRGFLPQRRIAGPGAEDSQRQFVSLAPFLTTREYLLTVFRELSNVPGAKEVFDTRHNPVWVLGPSSAAVDQLLAVFRPAKGAGDALPFVFDGEDTRFLGDLYEWLAQDVREKYALHQTPDFIEAFILDQTLDPAIKAFGIENVRAIDPTCGSGHFLLGTFRRLFEAWRHRFPAEDAQVLAQKCIAQVHGADINPYAVAIARFRLVLDFMALAEIRELLRCPPIRVNLCVADSLLHGVNEEQTRLSQLTFDGHKAWGDLLFQLADANETLRILGSRYNVVVGNPPYIKEVDATKNEAYVRLYSTCSGRFILSVPFIQRMFGLCVPDAFVGMINANYFAKRDYGERLVKDFLPTKDVTLIVDTSGAYIPGHATPTLLLFGRNRLPSDHSVIAVLGKRGERTEPPDASNAPVWSEIKRAYATPGFDGAYVSTELLTRAELAVHPWIMAGGGARQLKSKIDASAATTLGQLAADIGAYTITRAKDISELTEGQCKRNGIPPEILLPYQAGEGVRDWYAWPDSNIPLPYERGTWRPTESLKQWPELAKLLWPHRYWMSRRFISGGTRLSDKGLPYWTIPQLQKHRAGPFLCFAFVATHNYFVPVQESRIFDRSAPVVKLMPGYNDQIATIAGITNSSITGFWCRLVMFLKGGDQVGDGARVSPAPWDRHMEYAGNLLQALPMPDLDDARVALLPLVNGIEATVAQMQKQSPRNAVSLLMREPVRTAANLRESQNQAVAEHQRLHDILVSLQEEIDWRVYGLFGLPTVVADSVESVAVPVRPEHRPFEVRLARDVASDISARLWFERHKRAVPTDVAGPLADLYRRRVRLINSNKSLQLLETPETKRRWQPVDYHGEFISAWRSWLLDRIECLLEDQERPAAWTARAIAVELGRDPRVSAVAELLQEEGASLDALVSDLVHKEAVPHLAALRYTETGMERRAGWENTWALQRRDDAGEKVKMDVPDEYTTKDFRSDYWSHRGKLDVPKERFVLYPDAGPESDETPLVGWAGWDHLQRAQALAALYQARKTEDGWDADRLVPLLAGLHELVPWVLQWHNAPDEATGLQLGTFFQEYVAAQAHELGKSLHDLEAWRPAKATRGRKAGTPKASAVVDPGTLLAAVAERQGTDGVEVSALVEALAASAPKVKEVIKTLVESGQLRYTSKRPQRLALGSL